MIDPDFVALGEEKKIFDDGHTLSLVKTEEGWYSYKGGVRFEGIEIHHGSSIGEEIVVGDYESIRGSDGHPQ